jgi:hypothetical protein
LGEVGKALIGPMTIPILSWYLCVLFAVALISGSVMTVEPGLLAFQVKGTWLALPILFAAVAIIFKWFRIPQPKWLLRLFQPSRSGTPDNPLNERPLPGDARGK